MCGKVFALGFVPYLRDPWNILDFVVVLLGYLSFVPALGNYSAVRALRVFRAFKAVTAVPGLQLMVRALGVCMKQMISPGLLILFAVLFFGIIGLTSFMGKLKQTCVCLPEGFDAGPLLTNYTTDWSHDAGLWVEDYQHCGTVPGSRQCPTDPSFCASAIADRTGWDALNVSAVCLPLGENPGEGYTSFDNMGWALLSTVQLLTMDWWESIYDGVLQSTGWFAIFYFIVVIFLGGYYVINLILAVVTMAYAETKAEVEEEVAELTDEKAAISARRKKERAMAKLKVLRLLSKKETDDSSFLESESANARFCSCAQALKRVVEHVYFVNLITALIVLNTVTLALWYPAIPKWGDTTLSVLNYVFSAVFLIEMVFKMAAYGLKEYFFHVANSLKDSPNRSGRTWNWFDCLVVVASVVELMLELSPASGSETQGLSVLRSVRIVRILKLGKNWKTMQRLVAAIGSSVENIAYLTIVLIMVIYIFAALGMQMFREDYFAALNASSYDEVAVIINNEPERYESDVPRWSFIDFSHSFMFVFRVLCGEWIEPLHSAMLFSNMGLSVAFFLITLLVCNFVVMNLFIALLIGVFSEQQLEETQRKIIQQAAAELAKVEKAQVEEAVAFWDARASAREGKSPTNASEEVRVLPKVRAGSWRGADSPETFIAEQGLGGEADAGVGMIKHQDTQSSTTSSRHERMMSGLCCCYKPLETAVHKSRTQVLKLITSNGFEGIILVMILWSSIMLGFDDHLNRENQKLHELMDTFNVVFAVVFTAEAALKIFGLGWKIYFKEGWNVLDFFLVVVGITSAIIASGAGGAGSAGLTAMRTLRALRALRPMRAIRRWESMRIIIDALLASVPAIANVIVFSVLVFTIFAIVGVQLFGGKFGCCIDSKTMDALSHNVVANRTTCNSSEVGYDVIWQVPPLNFDNVINAMVALFHVAIFEGWMQVMDSSTDAVGIEMQPIYKNSFSAYGFYVVFICLGSFFTLNLFIGVIIDNFQARKKHLEEMGKNGGVFLTEQQKRLMDAIRTAMDKKPPKLIPAPQWAFPNLCFKISRSIWFEVVVIIMVSANSVFLMMAHYEQSAWYTKMLWIANAAFTFFYVCEAAIKITGLRHHYFESAWNIFDFILVVIAVVSCVLDLGFSATEPWLSWNLNESTTASSLARLFRIIRVLRFGRLIRVFPRFKRLTTTLIVSLPALFNVFSLLFMIITIYSLVGLSLFKDVARNGALNDFVNFETFGSAFMLLYRLSSSAGVDEVEEACSIQAPFCNETFYGDNQTNCGSPGSAKIFFLTYVLIAFFVLVNTYIAVILDNLDHIRTEEAQPDGISESAVTAYYTAWSEFDPKATRFIEYSKLQQFLNAVPGTLGYKGHPEGEGCTDEELRTLEIPLYTKSVLEKHSELARRQSNWKPDIVKRSRSSRFRRNKVGPGRKLSAGSRIAETLDSEVPKAHCVSILKIMVERAIDDESTNAAAGGNNFRIQQLIQQETDRKFQDLSYLGIPPTHTGIYKPAGLLDRSVDRGVRRRSTSPRYHDDVRGGDSSGDDDGSLESIEFPTIP